MNNDDTFNDHDIDQLARSVLQLSKISEVDTVHIIDALEELCWSQEEAGRIQRSIYHFQN